MVQPPSPSPLLQSVSPPRLAPSRWPPLMGFASPPRRRIRARVHSHPILGPGFGRRLPHRQSRSALVVSHHLDGFLRERAVSLLHLTAGKRFATFPPRGLRRRRSRTHTGRSLRLPRSATTPLEEFPSSTAVPRHRGRCPPGVAARHTTPATTREGSSRPDKRRSPGLRGAFLQRDR